MICPSCGKERDHLSVVSMKDNNTLICLLCGMLEVCDKVEGEYLSKNFPSSTCERCGRVHHIYNSNYEDNGKKICPWCMYELIYTEVENEDQ